MFDSKKWHKEWYIKNKEAHDKRGKLWRENNSEEIKKYHKEYWDKNKDEIKLYRKKNEVVRREYDTKYKKKRMETDYAFRVRARVRTRLNMFLVSRGFLRKNKFNQYIGCTPEELKIYLEKQFLEGMGWDNHSKWHIDHIIPLDYAKTEDEIYKLCRYTNLQPLWAEDNLKKGKKI